MKHPRANCQRATVSELVSQSQDKDHYLFLNRSYWRRPKYLCIDMVDWRIAAGLGVGQERTESRLTTHGSRYHLAALRDMKLKSARYSRTPFWRTQAEIRDVTALPASNAE